MEIGVTERWLRAAALALLLILGGYQVAVSWQHVEQFRWPENVIDAGFEVVTPWPAIGKVSPRAAEAGLRVGDRLVEVHGKPYAGEGARAATQEKLFPGDRIRVTVEGADGARREVSWQLAARDGGMVTVERISFLGAMSIGMPLLCLAIGFGVVWARPSSKQTWLLLGVLATFPHVIVHPGFFSGPTVIAVPFYELHALMRGLWGLFMFLFAWEFPRLTPWQERAPRMERVLAAILLLSAFTALLQSVMVDWGEPSRWADWIDVMAHVSGVSQLVQMAGVSCFFALITHKSFALKDPDSQRRLRIILAGAMVALTPLFLLLIGTLVTGKVWAVWAVVPALLLMGLFPVTLAYVIVVHRAFGISMAVRQGLQYALARRGVRAVQIVFSAGAILAAVVMATQPGMNRPRILQVVAGGAVVVLFLQRAAEWLSGWVDRRFFREAYAAEQVLASLSEDVRTMVETRPLLEAVVTRISQALHVERISMLLREGDGFQPAYAIGIPDPPIPGSAKTVELLRRERAPLRVYLEDKASWIFREGLDVAEVEWLKKAGAELLLPLAVKDKLLGFVSLGKKRSEEPYSAADLRLLQSVAVQTGLALENSQLAAAITEAVAQRERLNREVEIAQEVQERLFPQNMPEIPGLDYWGYCRPARGVGGDSYDFLQLESGVFALSIGDVSGKGIPAALLMASLQSALRGQAMSMPADLGVMIGTLNRLIFDSSPSNRYATLFYGQYDPVTRVMTYVNGGHNPPMILRGEQLLRLEEGGPVVGLFRPARFTQGTILIERGDVFVGFTDGVSEAMNAADEEWGEEALGELLRGVGAVTAKELIPRIMAAADAFAAGAPQHDDMTLVVVRFL